MPPPLQELRGVPMGPGPSPLVRPWLDRENLPKIILKIMQFLFCYLALTFSIFNIFKKGFRI